jgi:hypothetical protein
MKSGVRYLMGVEVYSVDLTALDSIGQHLENQNQNIITINTQTSQRIRLKNYLCSLSGSFSALAVAGSSTMTNHDVIDSWSRT